jgi:hypothetical protein
MYIPIWYTLVFTKEKDMKESGAGATDSHDLSKFNSCVIASGTPRRDANNRKMRALVAPMKEKFGKEQEVRRRAAVSPPTLPQHIRQFAFQRQSCSNSNRRGKQTSPGRSSLAPS